MKILENILKEAFQLCPTTDIPPIQGALSLTQVGCPQSTGSQLESKSHNIEDTTGSIQVQSPFRSTVYPQL